MIARSQGLTATYNRLHDQNNHDPDIKELRELQVRMDYSVSAAYGWDNIDLHHGFHLTKQGVRFTLDEEARRRVLDRLLKLNHERYAAEVAAGKHDKKKARKSSKKESLHATSLF